MNCCPSTKNQNIIPQISQLELSSDHLVQFHAQIHQILLISDPSPKNEFGHRSEHWQFSNWCLVSAGSEDIWRDAIVPVMQGHITPIALSSWILSDYLKDISNSALTQALI